MLLDHFTETQLYLTHPPSKAKTLKFDVQSPASNYEESKVYESYVISKS